MPSTSAPRVEHVADGNTVEFNFDFAIFQSGDLEVFLDASRQVDGFTVRGGYPSNGGTVVFPQAPAAGTVVILQRRVSIERATDFRPSAALHRQHAERGVRSAGGDGAASRREHITCGSRRSDGRRRKLAAAGAGGAGRADPGIRRSGGCHHASGEFARICRSRRHPRGREQQALHVCGKREARRRRGAKRGQSAAGHGRGESQRLGALAALLCAARHRRHGADMRAGRGGEQRLRPHRSRRSRRPATTVRTRSPTPRTR